MNEAETRAEHIGVEGGGRGVVAVAEVIHGEHAKLLARLQHVTLAAIRKI